MPVSTTAHIRLDDRGVAWIDDTNTKVIEVALDMIAHGWSPEEIHFQHAHLSLAQIHAALARISHKPSARSARTTDWTGLRWAFWGPGDFDRVC